jgi:hypothetical protein
VDHFCLPRSASNPDANTVKLYKTTGLDGFPLPGQSPCSQDYQSAAGASGKSAESPCKINSVEIQSGKGELKKTPAT